jgi:hypothetical protein
LYILLQKSHDAQLPSQFESIYFPIFVHFSVFHSLQSIIPCILLTKDTNTFVSRGLSGYRARRWLADSRGPVLVAGLSLNEIGDRGLP